MYSSYNSAGAWHQMLAAGLLPLTLWR